MLIYLLFQIFMQNGPVAFLVAFVLITLPLLLSVTIHEWAHGFTAYKFGDPTPKEQGRLSFNPFAHLDPFGTIMLFTIGIGWAKPVQINLENIKGRTRLMLVALAGPLSNVILAIIFALVIVSVSIVLFKSGMNQNTLMDSGLLGIILILLKRIVEINIMLALFNMLPLPPLDGSNVLKWIMPDNMAKLYEKLAPFGMVILISILFTVGFGFISQTANRIETYMYYIIENIIKSLLPG